MKIKITLTICLLLFLTNFYKSQLGTDFIIVMDNSGSISNTEFTQISQSTKEIIENILSCNTNNKVSVVHYATHDSNIGAPSTRFKIYIESDFTNNVVQAQSFIRRLQGGDYFHETIEIIDDALNGIPNANIASPQTTLSHNPANQLVIILFTDATRHSGNSLLVKEGMTALNDSNAFQIFTKFKNERKAKFVLVHVNGVQTAINAGAAIASAGGSYYGTLEAHPQDPDLNLTPRLYLNKRDFVLTANEINILSNEICTLNNEICHFTFEPIGCKMMNFPIDINGSYILPTGATINSFTINLLNTTTGVSTPTTAAVTYTGPGLFQFIINPADLPITVAGNFRLQVKIVYTIGGITREVLGYNTDRSLTYDLDFCCDENKYITYPYHPSTIKFEGAEDYIISSSEINNGATTTFQAGNEIILKNNFHAKAGSTFKAIIEECAGKPVATTINKNTEQYEDPNPNGTETSTPSEFNNFKRYITPNPNKGIFTIHLPKAESGTLEVYSINGKMVYNRSIKNEKDINVNIQNLPNGNYIVKLNTNNLQINEKIIKY